MDVKTYVDKAPDPWGLLETGVDKRRAALIKRHIGKAGMVLDVGCAFGIYSNFLRSLGNYVVSLDASKRMVSAGKKLFSELTFVLGSGESLPFMNNTFNSILCMGTLIYSADRRKFLSEFYRTLRKRGRLCIIERNRNSPMHSLVRKLKKNEKSVDNPSNYFTRAELEKLLVSTGFRIKKASGDYVSMPFSSGFASLAEAFPSLAYFLVFECEKE